MTTTGMANRKVRWGIRLVSPRGLVKMLLFQLIQKHSLQTEFPVCFIGRNMAEGKYIIYCIC